MKKILLLLSLTCVLVTLKAQVPQVINFQGTIRNLYGNAIENQNVKVRLSIRNTTPTGAVLYSETRAVTTNLFGLINIGIGSPGAETTVGSMGAITWNTGGAKFIQFEADPTGGTNFINYGTTAFNSNAYAFFAGSAAPVGVASGVLSGTYPNPGLALGGVVQSAFASGTVALPNGLAGGVFSGSYPNPNFGAGTITGSMLAAGTIPTTLPPTGTAGGVLSGTYPNPGLGNGVVTNTNIAAGVMPTTLPPSGAAGGALTGTYPNPTIANAAVTTPMIAAGVIPTTLPPIGAAGGILTGTYPNPSIANAAITSPMMAAGIFPTTLPPVGPATGDLNGTYPNPTVDGLRGSPLGNQAPEPGYVLFHDGTQWKPSPYGDSIYMTTPWQNVSATFRDTTIDGTALKVSHIVMPHIDQTAVEKGAIQTYFKIPGDVSIFPFPYTSNAGGVKNTMSSIPTTGKIFITRFTHNNSGSIGVSSSLQYRTTIIRPLNKIKNSDWQTVSTAFRDTTIDGTALKVSHIVVPDLTQDVIERGLIQAYFQIPGDVSIFPIQYTSFAGGKVNTIRIIPTVGKYFILRFSHDNSGSVGVSSSLRYRLVYTDEANSAVFRLFNHQNNSTLPSVNQTPINNAGERNAPVLPVITSTVSN